MHRFDRVAPFGRWSFLIGPLLVVLITVGFWWKLVLTNQFTFLNSPDLARQVLPWYQFEASEWHAGRVPLWDPNDWFGQPLIGQMQPGVAYPLNWLLFQAPLKRGQINRRFLHWYFVVIHLMAALFAYWLCRDLGCSLGASLVGSTLYAGGGFFASTDWPQMLNGAVWAPLVFLFLLRAVRGKRPWSSAALSGLSLGMAWLSGHHQIPTFISLAVAGTWLFFIFRGGRPNFRIGFIAAVALVITGMVGALQLLPSAEYAKLAVRWVGMPTPVEWQTKVAYSVHSLYGFRPLSILGLIFAGWYGYTSAFVGVTGLALAVIGVAARWRWLAVRVFTFVGLGGILFSLAHYNVLHGILWAVLPLVDKARTPAMAVVVFNCAAAALAAWGVDSLLDPDSQIHLRRAIRALGVLSVLLFGAIMSIELFKGFPSNGDERPMITLLAALLLAGLLQLCRNRRLQVGGVAALTLLLLMMELGTLGGFSFSDRYDETREDFLKPLTQNSDVVGFLRRQPGLFRVEVDHAAYAPNFGDLHGIQESAGYLASITKIFGRYDVFMPDFMRLAGVRYSISPKPKRSDYRQVFSGVDGLNIYELPDAFPRAFLTSKAEKLNDSRKADEWLHRPEFHARTQTFVTGDAPKLGGCEDPGSARVEQYSSSSIRIVADARCKSMVVLTDTFYPGWKATVDGRDAGIYDAYAVFRGVVIEPGSHIVEFRYRPSSVILGASLTGLGLLLVLGLCVWERRRPETLAVHGESLGCTDWPSA
jgi:hypothetical protein